MPFKRWFPNFLLALVGVAILATFPLVSATPIYPAVKVMAGDGHGSGVHIGNNQVITAAHVVAGQKLVRVKTMAGEETTGEVLWFNTEYDVALVQAYDLRDVRTAELVCGDLPVGSPISVTGYPGRLEFIRTSGAVASLPAPRLPHWRMAYIADLTVMGGNSGGPAYDSEGRVRGIVVGVALQSVGFSSSIVPFTYVVPGSVLCTLMGRSA